MAKQTESELLSTGKIAEKLGATPAKVKKVITELQLEATEVKCRCSYYSPEQVKKIEEGLK
jgi:biotin operon repressor